MYYYLFWSSFGNCWLGLFDSPLQTTSLLHSPPDRPKARNETTTSLPLIPPTRPLPGIMPSSPQKSPASSPSKKNINPARSPTRKPKPKSMPVRGAPKEWERGTPVTLHDPSTKLLKAPPPFIILLAISGFGKVCSNWFVICLSTCTIS